MKGHTDMIRDIPRMRDIKRAVPGITRAQAIAAWAELRRLVRADLADCYTSFGSHGTRRQVWLSRRVQPIDEQRVSLADWCLAFVEAANAQGGDA
jgi:hypothetical protein